MGHAPLTKKRIEINEKRHTDNAEKEWNADETNKNQ